MITYESPGAVKRFAFKLLVGPTKEQRDIIGASKIAHIISRRVPTAAVISPVDGRIIMDAKEEEYLLYSCVMNPELIRFETDNDFEEWKNKHPDYKIVDDLA